MMIIKIDKLIKFNFISLALNLFSWVPKRKHLPSLEPLGELYQNKNILT